MSLDFVKIREKSKNNVITMFPDFVVSGNIKDLMIRGKSFYAVWDERLGLWDTREETVQKLIDSQMFQLRDNQTKMIDISLMTDFSSNVWLQWQKYVKSMPDNYHELDTKITFLNTDVKKNDYVSKRLPYAIEKCQTPAYDKIMSTLYKDEEREKLEWAIGAIISGDSKKLQKFIVLYGGPGTGKSTVLNIIQQLFEGYYTMFDAKELASNNTGFALEQFKSNPLVAIQHDGDLSHIEDNTKLNSIVSHERMVVNEKFKSQYNMRFNSFLFMGTNKPVHISDAKSGLTRRLIDVRPSNQLLSPDKYVSLIGQIPFELGGIADHCLEVYKKLGYHHYDNYVPEQMMMATNDFYDFVEEEYDIFKRNNATTLDAAWNLYGIYNEAAGVNYPYPKRKFREELKNYFDEYHERKYVNGENIRHYYSGFCKEKFGFIVNPDKPNVKMETWLKFNTTESLLDVIGKDWIAQLAKQKDGAMIPNMSWKKCKTTLKDIPTNELHYVKVPLNHIVIDFDIKNENGEKDYDLNLAAASKFPPTYAELSKSGAGIHLHYIYSGDVNQLSRVYDNNIEIKVFIGDASLRRQLTKCNDLPIATINSGLPLKPKGNTMIDDFVIKSEKALRTMIIKNLNKEYHEYTKPSMDYIYKILDDAYNQGLHYDVTDLRQSVLSFAMNSSNNADYCMRLLQKMKFKSDEPSPGSEAYTEQRNVFYDIEVFPNLFLINWKYAGTDTCIRMINPSPTDVEQFMKMKLIGFNVRRYDNHICYAAMMGYDNEQLFKLSQQIISGDNNAMFGEAYNLSYTDVYDFASAGNKKSLKKLEIEMNNISEDELKEKGFTEDEIKIIKKGSHHKELGFRWDEPVPEEKWNDVAEYCDNDVIATEAAFTYLKADWTARQILADLAGMTVNDTTNSLTTRIIFQKNRNPQNEFHYRDLSKPVHKLDPDVKDFLEEACPDMMAVRHGEAQSLLPYFPGYEFKNGISTYRGIEVGEGGEVYAEPGMYIDVALLDISSMHPHSTIAECLFGVRYTRAYRDIVEGRVSIKHKAWEEVNNMLEGRLTPYIQRVKDGLMTAADLANALKTAINSVYGLTAAKFANPFKDPRNKDNIVAKRGALFMIDLMYEVQARGFTVAHIKTDSIKIPNATPEIIRFVMDYGKQYGYTFEHEATYERMCLVNNAVYVAKYKSMEECQKMYGYVPSDNSKKSGKWTATGTQFQVPYVFKTLFSKEPITFADMCETKSVTSSLYLDMNEKLPDVSEYEELKELRKKMPSWCEIGQEASKKAEKMLYQFRNLSDEELDAEIAKGHDYHFIGRVGLFCPIKNSCGGGQLVREKDGKYLSATGCKDYRWLEAEMVELLGKENDIDQNYYRALVDDAVSSISQYGDFEWFVSPLSNDPQKNELLRYPPSKEIPFH